MMGRLNIQIARLPLLRYLILLRCPEFTQISEFAQISDLTQISDFTQISYFAQMYEFTQISDLTQISDSTQCLRYARLPCPWPWVSDSLCDTNVDCEEITISSQDDRSTLELGALMLLEY